MWSWGGGWLVGAAGGYKQGFAAERKERKGAVALSVRGLYTLACARTHTLTHTRSVSSASLSERVSQWMVVCGVCVCGEPMLDRARHHPSPL